MTDPWDAPVGARKAGGRLAWRYGLWVDAQGTLYGAAKPTPTALPVDTIVRNTGSAPANASEWVYTGATYGWCARSFTQFVKNGAPSGAPNDVGIVMVDGTGKHGYVSVDTTTSGWKQIDN